ncbi:MAG TPA: MBL fold metallo-hydrolase [Vicinamibacterales bacterium]|nr:MBL fold metallo-hydrolase [Vicinamibacterales bacterium]
MKRRIVLTSLVIVGLFSIAAGAMQQQPAGRGGAPGGGRGINFGTPSVDNLQVEKLTDTLYVLRGGGGNTAAFITANGVLLVDTKVSGWGQPIIQKLKTLTDKPVTTIVNTHTHFDHVNGNAEFPPTVEVVTSEQTKMYMEQWNPVFGLQGDNPSPFKANGGVGLPKRTFKETLSIGQGADQVDLHFYGPAHTGGDTWVVFRSARVMHAGDAFAGKNAPIMDRNNGGSALRYSDTIARAAKTPNVDRVITGHSTIMTIADLREFGEFNGEFVRDALAAKKAGKTIDQFVAEWNVPAKFAGYTNPPANNRGQWRSNAQVAWEEMGK